MTGALTITQRIERASELLAGCTTPEEWKAGLDMARAVVEYARRRSGASIVYADAWEVMQIATRGLGEVCAEMPKGKAGRKPKTEIVSDTESISKSAELEKHGITSRQAHQFEKHYEIPEEEWRLRVERGKHEILATGKAPNILAHSASSTYDSDSYGTPDDLLEAGRELLGGDFDLDPCSNAAAQRRVRAKTFWTKEDDCLAQKIWKAQRLWMNPPFSRVVKPIIERLLIEVDAGHVKSALVLVNNQTSENWFQSMMERYPTWFSSGRVPFIVNDVPLRDTRQGQAMFYIGPKLPLFRKLFEKKIGGLVVVH